MNVVCYLIRSNCCLSVSKYQLKLRTKKSLLIIKLLCYKANLHLNSWDTEESQVAPLSLRVKTCNMRPYILNYMMDLKFVRFVITVIDKNKCHAKHILIWKKVHFKFGCGSFKKQKEIWQFISQRCSFNIVNIFISLHNLDW